MANNTVSINKIVSIFQDLSIRQEMVNDFGYGPAYNIGTSREMNFPYIWVENGTGTTQRSDNGFKTNLYTFTIYCMDKINFGEDNYNEIISDTHYILDTMVQEISQHKYYVDMNLSIDGDIQFTPVIEATDDNVNGWQIDITIKQPIRYTYCNSPIEPISGYTTQLNNTFSEYRLVTYYGSFYDTTTQTNAGATAVNILSYDTTDISKFVVINNGTQITTQKAGVYNIQFSAQLDKNDGGNDEIDIWLRKNGQDVPWTNTVVELEGNNAEVVAAWNFLSSSDDNDYYEICWHSTDTQMMILSRPAQINPVRPETPSVILTVTKVN